MSDVEAVRETPDCTRCRHFYVTWEPDHPRGCRAYGFKTVDLPTAVVLRESGRPCQLFERRTRDDQRRRGGTGE